MQPIDAPDDAATVAEAIEHLGSDELLLFATDFPHWQFDGDEALPPGLPEPMLRKILIDNPLATYSRLEARPSTMSLERAVERDAAAMPQQRLSVVDCDIHPIFRSASAAARSCRRAGASTCNLPPPRAPGPARHAHSSAHAGGPHRRRAAEWRAAGLRPRLHASQHLDPNGVEWGLLQALAPAAMPSAISNSAWRSRPRTTSGRLADGSSKEPRLRGGILVGAGDPPKPRSPRSSAAPQSRASCRSRSPRADEPLGRRRYWPIFEARGRNNLPIGLHVPGFSSGYASTPAGWPSFYIEEHQTFADLMQGVFTSLVLEGVFERFPKLRVVLIEGGFAWVPALCWRLDKHWERMRSEVPHVKRPPSEYIREHIWYTTQPIEEPEQPDDLTDIIDWIGWDRLLFSTDYPHWDFDDPRYAFKVNLNDAARASSAITPRRCLNLSMISKSLPHLIRGGYRFSEQIMLKQKPPIS